MKAFEKKLIAVIIGIIATAVHQCWTLEEEYADDLEMYEFSTLRSMNSLTPEEEALANEAKAHIAKTIEKNLIRLLVLASTQSDTQVRPRQPRQDEDDDDVTPNPNVLPQVAQILGAIFSGSLNITRVVDQTFGLVPNVVRNQVGGLVKLLTGANMTTTNAAATDASTKAPSSSSTSSETTTPVPTTVVSSTRATPARRVRTRTTSKPTPAPTEEPTPLEVEIEEIPETTAAPAPTTTTAATTTTAEPVALSELHQSLISRLQANSTTRNRYKIRNRNRQPSSSTPATSVSLLEDDEIEKLEDDLIQEGKAYETYMRDRDPKFIAEAFQRVFGRLDFNSSQISQSVPSIFKGAKQALVVLDNLGILDANDLLDELGLPTDEDQEE